MIDPTGPITTRASLASLSIPQLVARYAVGVECFDPRVMKLADSELDTAFRPEAGVGRWPCRTLLGHLADAEIAFTHRLRLVIGEDGPVFSTWDEESFLLNNLYGSGETGPNATSKHPVAAFIAVIHTQRRWMSEWLTTLTDAQWNRKAMHPQRGEQTTRVILEYATFHLEHHAWYLNAKVRKFN